MWLGCWDCQQAIPLRYAPSSAPLPTPDGSQVEGHFATFTLGYVAFQVFTVDYVAAGQHQASAWNDHVPASLAQALPRVWPPLLAQPEVLLAAYLSAHRTMINGSALCAALAVTERD